MNVWKISSLVFAAALAIVVGKDSFRSADAAEAVPTESTTVGYDWAKEQPNMERALKDLQAARASLLAAAEHKGGWRVAAIKNVDVALAETKRGMEYAKNHPHDD